MGGWWGGGGGGEENTEEGITVLVPQGTEGVFMQLYARGRVYYGCVFRRKANGSPPLSLSVSLSLSVCLSPSLSLPLSTNNRRKLMCMDA